MNMVVGRPCIRGTRSIRIWKHEDILAAIEYAARQTDHPVLRSALSQRSANDPRLALSPDGDTPGKRHSACQRQR